ncbi:YjgN family protein [Magnetococcus marinus]|uniref:YjgN family protein n=1 Tax=Magnetococcus marinus TaxID=1124597 RepID=UPI00135F1326|nr:YjgN family protein [Magnetococcus marinus]
MTFHGKGSDYFKIWFVNWALTIVTLGIYSAWAKVRRNRYFYNHTLLDGHNFDYTADPMRILKGRLIAAAIVIPMSIMTSSQITQWIVIGNIIYFGLSLMIPVIIVMAMRFSLRNSEYRGIHFNFTGKISRSYGVYILWSIASALSASLLLPVMLKQQQEFLLLGSRFGQSNFDAKPPLGSRAFYNALFYSAMIAFAWILMLFVAVTIFFLVANHTYLPQFEDSVINEIYGIIGFVSLIPLVLFTAQIMRAAMFAIIWNQAHLHGIYFRCKINIIKVSWIILSNLLMRLFSLGLLSPWCTIRIKKYLYESVRVEMSAAQKQHFLADHQNNQSGSLAEGVDDLVGFDVGI